MAECADVAMAEPPDADLEPPPSSTSRIVVGEANLQDQRDEVLAIQSIYEDSEEERVTVLSEPDENGCGLFQIRIRIPVAMPGDSCQVDLLMAMSQDQTVSGQAKGQGHDAGDQAMEGDQGLVEKALPAEEGEGAMAMGGAKEAEGATGGHVTPPPNISKAVALERSLSGQRWVGSIDLNYLCPMTLNLTFPPKYPSEDPPAFALSCVWLTKTQLSALCRQLDKVWGATPSMPIVFSWIDWLENDTFSFLGLTNSLVLVSEGLEDSDDLDLDGRAVAECDNFGQAVQMMLQYNQERDTADFCKALQECCLCLDEKPGTKFFRLQPCKHHFCLDCMAAHCNMHVTDGTIQLLTCPGFECKGTVPPDILQAVLSPENFIRWETLSLQRSLDEMDDVVYCPRCQCVVIRDADADLKLGYCMACCFSFCTECEQLWHQGTACTTEMERLESQAERAQRQDERARQRFDALRRKAEEMATSIRLIKMKMVKCPNCKVTVEKIEGCNKMTCRCGKSFCWLCGKGIDGYSHFQGGGGCRLFNYDAPGAQRVINRPRPPDALLWMQAQAEALGYAGNDMRCPQCKQTNTKIGNNNHLRCWNCKSHMCYICRTRITGVVTRHFMAGGCSQHS